MNHPLSNRKTMMRERCWCCLLSIVLASHALADSVDTSNYTDVVADVIVAGGSTAALAAAVAAAEAGVDTVLLEPTDWIGGQLTSSGVPAVDEAWHRILDGESRKVTLDVAGIARDPRNMTPLFRDTLLEIGNPGRGWVSRFCFEPRYLLEHHLLPLEARLSKHLKVYRETVVKQVVLRDDGQHVQAIVCVQRSAKPGHVAYQQLPSQELSDWYDPQESEHYRKQLLRFVGRSDASVFLDATEWGEVLVLSGCDFQQALDKGDDSEKSGSRCGQCTVFGFVQELRADPSDDSAAPATAEALGWGQYQGRPDAWEKVWTYRRIRGSRARPATGDLSLQNWGYSPSLREGGNDYPFGYLFQGRKELRESAHDWQGGVDLEVMRLAEQRALAWHHWLKEQTPRDIDPRRIVMAVGVLGTGHGLSKLPYIRDTRRSLGLDRYVLAVSDLVGKDGDRTGTEFPDTIAIGCYPMDVHPLVTCKYPAEVVEHRDTRPFCIPFRALTHYQLKNLLVCGKTMAQDFMANSATRLHPIEWSSGTAAGVAAAWMVQEKADSREAYRRIDAVRERVAMRTPIHWVIDEKFLAEPTENAP